VRTPLPPGTTGWPRFKASVLAILWHELGILLVGTAIIMLTWGKPNQVGTATFMLLWAMRISAKLNLFLGVRNLSEEFLPKHLAYMGSYFRRRRMNALLPCSVMGGLAVVAMLVTSARTPGMSAADVVGSTLVATLLVLAVLEHLLLVAPISATALWRWAMRHNDATPLSTTTTGNPNAAAALGTAPDSPLLPAR